MTTTTPERRPRVRGSWWPVVGGAAVIVLLVVLFSVFAAEDESDIGTQPAPDPTTFEQGFFDELPLPPRTIEIGERAEFDETVTATYAVRNMTAEEVLAFYEEALGARGWTVEEPPAARAGGVVGGSWIRENMHLHVTSSLREAVEPDVPEGEEETITEEYLTQLSLELTWTGP